MITEFLRYFWNTITHPWINMDRLAAQPTVRWAVLAACLPVLQVWGNVALHKAFGLDWLGTKPMLADPTFVAGFGQWPVERAKWVPLFLIFIVLIAVFDLVFAAGIAQLVSKLWGGQGTFEQMVNTMTFAFVVPDLIIAAASEWLFSVPMDLISGHPYWWNAAMQGEFGPVVGAVWNTYVLGVYVGLQYLWIIALGSIAIRRVQRIPGWASILTMLAVFGVVVFLQSVFIR